MNTKKRTPLDIFLSSSIIPIGLAPLAGTSSLTFRRICRAFGSDFSTTELVSARGIAYQGSIEKSFSLLEIDSETEGPCSIQLFGHDPVDFEKAIPLVLAHPKLASAISIDINMGCPVPKVVKTGAGSALMKTPDIARAIIEASVSAAQAFKVPVSVKIRSGWSADSVNAPEFAKMCADSGVAWLTIHGRTRDQMYHGRADWSIIAAVKAALKSFEIPVIGNGDVTDAVSAKKMIEETGVDAIAVGRAAQGNPWIFDQIRAELRGDDAISVSPQTRKQVMMRHVKEEAARIGELRACKEMRAQFAYYFKGQRNASAYKTAAMRADTIAEMEHIVLQWLITLGEAEDSL